MALNRDQSVLYGLLVAERRMVAARNKFLNGNPSPSAKQIELYRKLEIAAHKQMVEGVVAQNLSQNVFKEEMAAEAKGEGSDFINEGWGNSNVSEIIELQALAKKQLRQIDSDIKHMEQRPKTAEEKVMQDYKDQQAQRKQPNPEPHVSRAKAMLTTIEKIASNAIERIQESAKTAGEFLKTKQKEVKSRVKSLASPNLLQDLNAKKDRAISKIQALRDKAMGAILKLSSKNKETDVKKPEVGEPRKVKVNGEPLNSSSAIEQKKEERPVSAERAALADLWNMLDEAEARPDDASDNAATLQAKATVDTSHANLADEEYESELTSGELEWLRNADEDEFDDEMQEIAEELEVEVGKVETNFSETAKVMVKAADVKIATGINDLKKPAPTAGELAAQQKQDQMMSDLDAALKAIDDAAPTKSAAKSLEPTKDPGSGPSTPRAGH